MSRHCLDVEMLIFDVVTLRMLLLVSLLFRCGVVTFVNRFCDIEGQCHGIDKNVATLEIFFGADVATFRRNFPLPDFYLFFSSYSFLHTIFMLVNINLSRIKYLNSS